MEPHRRPSLRMSKTPGLVLIIAMSLVAGCEQRAPQIVSPPAAADGKAPCTAPADVIITEADLKLASAQLGELSVGGLEFSAKPKVVELVPTGARASRVADYLLCEAFKRGDVAKEDTARVDYLREFLMYMSTGPTPDQLRDYQREHRPPAAPTGRLEIPQLEEEQGKLVLAIKSIPPVQVFRVINAGDAPIQFWFARIPSERLYITQTGPIELAAGQSVEGAMVLVEFAGEGAGELPIELHTARPESSREVVVRVPEMAKVASAYRELAGELASDLVASTKSDPAFRRLVEGQAEHADAVAAMLVADVAQRTVVNKWPTLSAVPAAIVAGTLLEASSWPQAAVSLYQRAAAKSGPEGQVLLARSLARAEYFSSQSSDGTDKDQQAWVDFVSRQGQTEAASGAVLLHLAGHNPLVAEQNLINANAAASAIKDVPGLKTFAQTLRGDLALRNGKYAEAVKLYASCEAAFSSPACTLRKAEAELRNRDHEAAKKTLGTLGRDNASAADNLVYGRAMMQLGRQETG